MNGKSGRRRTALVGMIGAIALGVGGLGASAAAATVLSPANIDPDQTGSLTINKFVTPDTPWELEANGKPIENLPAGAMPLEGVTFEIVPVEAVGDVALDLTTTEGWDAAADLVAGDVYRDYAYGSAGYAFGSPVSVTTDADGQAVASDLSLGLYLVHETSAGNNPVTHETPPFLVSIPYPSVDDSSWIYDVWVYPKNDISDEEIGKAVSVPSEGVQPATVDWTITVPLVGGETLQGIKYLKVTDELDSRLTFVPGSETATLKGAGGESMDVTDLSDPGFTYAFTGQDMLFEMSGAVAAILSMPFDTLELTFTTAVDGAGIIENDATSWVNDWTSTIDRGDGPSTNWAPLTIYKHANGDTDASLQGAVFEIYDDADGAPGNLVGTYTTDESGMISVNLWVGNDDDITETYFVQEVKAPAGYVLPAQAITQVDLVADQEATVTTLAISNTAHKGPELPLTGASGQLLMTLGGLALILVGGGAFIVTNRRKQSER